MYSTGVLGWLLAASATGVLPWVSDHAYVTLVKPGHAKPPADAGAVERPNSCSALPRAANGLEGDTVAASGHAKHTVPLPARPASARGLPLGARRDVTREGGGACLAGRRRR